MIYVHSYEPSSDDRESRFNGVTTWGGGAINALSGGSKTNLNFSSPSNSNLGSGRTPVLWWLCYGNEAWMMRATARPESAVAGAWPVSSTWQAEHSHLKGDVHAQDTSGLAVPIMAEVSGFQLYLEGWCNDSPSPLPSPAKPAVQNDNWTIYNSKEDFGKTCPFCPGQQWCVWHVCGVVWHVYVWCGMACICVVWYGMYMCGAHGMCIVSNLHNFSATDSFSCTTSPAFETQEKSMYCIIRWGPGLGFQVAFQASWSFWCCEHIIWNLRTTNKKRGEKKKLSVPGLTVIRIMHWVQLNHTNMIR